MSGTVLETSAFAREAPSVSTPTPTIQSWIFAIASRRAAAISSLSEMRPPTTSITITPPSTSRPRRTMNAPAARGRWWRWSQPTAGEATTATTPPASTGPVIVWVIPMHPRQPDDQQARRRQQPGGDPEVAEPPRRGEHRRHLAQLLGVELNDHVRAGVAQLGLLAGRLVGAPPERQEFGSGHIGLLFSALEAHSPTQEQVVDGRRPDERLGRLGERHRIEDERPRLRARPSRRGTRSAPRTRSPRRAAGRRSC